MLSFIKGDRIHAAQDDGHVCFASNATLAERCHISIKSVERHVSLLVRAGLIQRVSSGNGKRWARRDNQGRVTLATGLSVLPLIDRHGEFLQLATAEKAHRDQLALLRDRCTLALRQLRDLIGELTPAVEAIAQHVRKILRRRADEAALTGLLSDLTVEISRIDASCADNSRGSHTISEGHKEPYKNPNVEKKSSNEGVVTNAEIETAYPKLCAQLRFAKTVSDCERKMDEIASYMVLGSAWSEAKQLGATHSFMLLGYVYERIEFIDKPQAYLRSLLSRLHDDRFSVRTLLSRPSPHRRRSSVSDSRKDCTETASTAHSRRNVRRRYSMGQLTVRNLDDEIIAALKARGTGRAFGGG